MRISTNGIIKGRARVSELNEDLVMDKLEGLEEIALYLHWSLSKTKRRVKEWRKAGILFTDYIGCPPRPMCCTFITLLQRWIVIRTQAGLHV